MRRAWLGHAAIALALTALTEIGGAIYVAALLVRQLLPRWRSPRLVLGGLFVALYAASWWPTERLAAATGRPPMPCTESVEAPVTASLEACVLHRHYASAPLRTIVFDLARAVNAEFPGTMTRSLESSFPFFDGIPVLPHLSHDDGAKLDLSFYYARAGAYRRGEMASPLGYWAFQQPRAGDVVMCTDRLRLLTFRWDMPWFVVLTRRDLSLEPERTRFALLWLASEGARRGIGKIFIEPYLARRLGVSGDAIRFQGCRAARHDDHVHVQLR